MNNRLTRSWRTGATETPVTTIRPLTGWVSVNIRELLAYRELLYFLTWRNVRVRYKQTVIGLAWAVVQPVFMTVIFTLFFGTLARIPSADIPYPLFSCAALLPWQLFASGLSQASNCLLYDSSLIQKVYFPRLILPISSVLSPLVDFLVGFAVLLGLMLYFGHMPGVTMLWLLPLLVLEFMFTLGMGLWLSAINIEYRDVVHILPFLIQLMLFASPVIYSSTFVPGRFQVAYGLLNPMSGIIEAYRWAILGTEAPSYMIGASGAITLLVLISGVFFFLRRERIFADVA